ncbi:MAG: threonine synthase, partial [Proteiniphilum sp.]|nr:threonine synthase [Proteiniphilum sp.]
MHYYSTQKKAPTVTLQEAVVKGLAPDRGLYMPDTIQQMPDGFFDGITHLELPEIAKTVAGAFFGEDIPKEELDTIVTDTL